MLCVLNPLLYVSSPLKRRIKAFPSFQLLVLPTLHVRNVLLVPISVRK